ncbi:MAG TPA: BTAD domain-containing putative transcriptional regulator [Acidimicrobiales bacterium]
MPVRIELLGPLRLTVDGEPVDVPGPRRRGVLALLAMAGGRAVTTDELLDAVWPGAMPESGRRALHSHVSRLRGHLGPAGDRLRRVGDGYRLGLGPGELDVDEARRAAGRAAGRPGAGGDGAGDTTADPADRAGALAGALALWRGQALAEFADVAPLAADAIALAELRLDLTDDWIEQRLATPGLTAGAGGAGLIVDATRAAAESPLRERTHALLVRALAAGGRQADALRVAHDFRTRLVSETGLDPGPDLATAEQAAALGVLSPAPAPATPARASRPRPAAPLVGRDHELATLGRRIGEERLVTVVGPGGVGKTRLALEVAADASASGCPVTVVELAAVQDARRVAATVAAGLGLRPRRDDEVLAAARDALATGDHLLVLDNCEHVADAARDVAATLVDGCAGLRVLATSRAPLGLAAEHVVRLGPLPVPEAGATDIAGVPAVDAFLAHARRRQPDLRLDGEDAAAVAEVVRRLDGLPLALELAAGRIGALSLTDLRARLDRALDLLDAGRVTADARHRTLRHAIDWSYRALADPEAEMLGAVAVFPGGVDLATAELLGRRLGLAADPAGVVAHLVDTSMLVVADEAGPHRYRALETVRTFALDQLGATGRRAGADAGLVAWAVDLAADVSRLVAGPDEPVADARVRRELANLRAAWDVAGGRGDHDARVAVVVGLDDFATYRDVLDLAVWALELAGDPGLAGHPRRAEVLGAAAVAAWRRGDLDLAQRLGETAVAVADEPRQAAQGLSALGTVALFRGDPRTACERWLTVADTAPNGARYLPPAALAAGYAGDVDRARSLLDRAIEAADALGAPSHRAFAAYAAAEMAAGPDPDAATDLYGRAIELARRSGATFVEGVASVGVVRLWGASGRTRQALEGYRRLIHDWQRAGHWTQMWTTLRNAVAPLADAGQPEAAALALAAADAAPEAALVTVDVVVAELAALGERLGRDLGPTQAASLRDRAARMPRTEVVATVLAAIDAALA